MSQLEPMDSPSSRAAVEPTGSDSSGVAQPSTPDTTERPRQAARPEARFHSRCGLVHPMNCCPVPMIKGIGASFQANNPGTCSICGVDFVTDRDSGERSYIVLFLESGYVHRECMVAALQPYHGEKALSLQTRIDQTLDGQSEHIRGYVERALFDADMQLRTYELTDAAPGSGKTKVLVLSFVCAPSTWHSRPGAAVLRASRVARAAPRARPSRDRRLPCAQVLAALARIGGPLKYLQIAYNSDAADTLRARGAINSHTLHSLGMRANSRCVLMSIRHRRQ